MAFQKAQRQGQKAKIMLMGPSNGGKTLSALILAAKLAQLEGQPLEGSVAVIDTEQGRSSYYLGSKHLPKGFWWDTEPVDPPHDALRYVRLIEAARKEYKVLIWDSMTPVWNAAGGLRDLHDKIVGRGKGNEFTAWGEVGKHQKRLIDALMLTDIHFICTVRSKMGYEFIKEEGKKGEVKKLGFAPEWRAGLEYEFPVAISLDGADHTAIFSKDNTGLFEDQTPELVQPKHAEILWTWLQQAQPAPEYSPQPVTPVEHREEAAPSRVTHHPATTKKAAPKAPPKDRANEPEYDPFD